MSTKITTIYDAIYTKVDGLMTDHTELPRPFAIDENDDLFLRKGYAIYIGPAVQNPRHATCNYWVQRNLIITNTLSIYGADTNKTIRKTAEKNLLENQILLIDGLEKDITLGDTLNNLRFVSDNGIEFIYADQKNYLMLQSTFSFEYFESLN